MTLMLEGVPDPFYIRVLGWTCWDSAVAIVTVGWGFCSAVLPAVKDTALCGLLPELGSGQYYKTSQ